MIVVSILIAGCAAQQSVWKKAKESNSISEYQKYLQKYPEGEFSTEAKSQLVKLEFEKAKEKDSIDGYEKFLQKYPDSEFSNYVKKKLEKLEYDKSIDANTIESYEQFLLKYPDSEQKSAVKKKIINLEFSHAKRENTINAFEAFLKKYPDNKYKEHVDKEIEKLEFFDDAAKSGSIDKYIDFFSKYDANEYLQKIPNSTLRKEIETQLSLINISKSKIKVALPNFVTFIKDNQQNLSKYKKAVQKTLDGISDKIEGNISQKLIDQMIFLEDLFITKNHGMYEKIATSEIGFVMTMKYMETKNNSFGNMGFNYVRQNMMSFGLSMKKFNGVKNGMLNNIIKSLEISSNQKDRLRAWSALDKIFKMIDLEKLAKKEGQAVFGQTLADIIQDIDIPFSDIQNRLTKTRKKDKKKENLEITSKIISNLKEIKFKVDNEAKIYEFIYEAGKGTAKKLNSYLIAGVNINAQNNDGETALMNACDFSNIENIRFLLKNGADAKIKDNKGKTALFHACKADYGRLVPFKADKYIPSINLLLKAGSDINEQDNSGRTVLMFSAASSYADFVEFLLQKKPKIDIQADNGETALISLLRFHHGSNEENSKILKLLIKNGADVNLASNDGETPLMYAVDSYDNYGQVEQLLEKGANPNAKDNKGKSVLRYAKYSFKPILEKYGVK